MNERFNSLRKRVFAMIKRELEIGDCCKSYEGTIEVTREYPDYFGDPNAEQSPYWWCITLHCYILGAARHYDFSGKTFAEALSKFESQIEQWERRHIDG